MGGVREGRIGSDFAGMGSHEQSPVAACGREEGLRGGRTEVKGEADLGTLESPGINTPHPPTPTMPSPHLSPCSRRCSTSGGRRCMRPRGSRQSERHARHAASEDVKEVREGVSGAALSGGGAALSGGGAACWVEVQQCWVEEQRCRRCVCVGGCWG